MFKIISALVLVAAFLGLGAAIQYYRAEMIEANAKAFQLQRDLRIAVDANDSLKASLERARKTNAENERQITELTNEIVSLNETVLREAQEEKELKDANQSVRDYLNTPIPPELWLQLNR